jgi:DNA-binding protein H-NS
MSLWDFSGYLLLMAMPYFAVLHYALLCTSLLYHSTLCYQSHTSLCISRSMNYSGLIHMTLLSSSSIPHFHYRKKNATAGGSKEYSQNNHDRNTKFGRSGRGPSRDGKRAYDRRSGTGRGKELKKGGGGARNWGSNDEEARQGMQTDEVADQLEQVVKLETEGGEAPPEDAGEEEPKVEEEEAVEPEPEDKTMSYEEYLESKKQQSDNPLLAPVQERQLDASEFANVKAKVSVTEDFLVMGGKTEGGKSKKKSKEKVVQKIDTGFRVQSGSSEGGRGRGRGGGRFGDREGGGRYGDREGGRFGDREGGGRGRYGDRDGEGGGGRGRGRYGDRDGEGGGGRGRYGDRDGEGRGRGGGRGRGRGARGPGRGGDGGGRSSVNTMDPNAFPAL